MPKFLQNAAKRFFHREIGCNVDRYPDVCEIGDGPKILVIHGGPGFGYLYLLDALSFLSADYTLIFYDQLNCSSVIAGGKPTLDAMARQLSNVVREFDNSPAIKVIAHSWGALVLAAAAAHPSSANLLRHRISGGIMINPVPLTRHAYDQSMGAFVARIPWRTQLYVYSKALLGRDGREIMQLLWPFYLSPGSNALFPDFPFDICAYKSVVKALGHFDYQSELDFLSRFCILQSSMDVTKRDMIGDWAECCAKYEQIEGVGHFPMLERPETWIEKIKGQLQ